MASIFGHAVLASAIGSTLSVDQKIKVILWGVVCSIIPDADILSFRFGIPYEHLFGHRGITHSFFFSTLFAALITALFFRNMRHKWRIFSYLFICTISHAILDAMTTGGRGVAFWAPFSDERFFLPFRKILVSPIGAANFFSEWGLAVLKSELVWIGIPSLCLFLVGRLFKNQDGDPLATKS